MFILLKNINFYLYQDYNRIWLFAKFPNKQYIDFMGDYTVSLDWGVLGLEAELEGEEEGSGTDEEGVFGAGKGAVVYVSVVPFIKQIIGGEGEAELAVDFPDSGCVEQYQIGGVPFRESSEEVLCSEGEVKFVKGDEGDE